MLKDLQEMIPDSMCLIGESDESTREDVLQNVEENTNVSSQQNYSMKGYLAIVLILFILLIILLNRAR